jgi:ATP synthase protein I
VKDSRDDRPPLVVAAEWTSRVTTVSLEMALPGVIGLWIDRQLGILPLFLVLGVILGMTVGMMHLLRMVTPPAGGGPKNTRSAKDKSDPGSKE